MTFVPRIYINPYGQKPNRLESSKSIFKENNLHSNLIKSVDVNQLTNIFDNDSILNGMELDSVTLSNNDRSLNFVLLKGRIIQDRSIIEILEDINLSIDIFSQYNIIESNISEHYFKILGNQTINFSNGKTFGIFNSEISENNHLNWSVDHTEYDGNTYTKIYTHQNISSTNTTGLLVNNNFSGESGQVILMSKYKYYETLEDNLVEFIPLYKFNNLIYPTFDSNLYRMIYGVINIEKDNTICQITDFNLNDKYTSIVLEDSHYINRNINYTHKSFFDGGIIN